MFIFLEECVLVFVAAIAEKLLGQVAECILKVLFVASLKPIDVQDGKMENVPLLLIQMHNKMTTLDAISHKKKQQTLDKELVLKKNKRVIMY
jgi:hypothetical protein